MPDHPEAYDLTHFDPPAPVARVSLRASDGGAAVDDVLLLIDTGADVTLLPRKAIDRLGVPIRTDGSYELVGFDGARSVAEAVDLVVRQPWKVGWRPPSPPRTGERGPDGTRRSMLDEPLDMISHRRLFRWRYLLIEEERGIPGRDVLNHSTILLEGPGQQWSLRDT